MLAHLGHAEHWILVWQWNNPWAYGVVKCSLGEVDVEDNPDGERKKTRQNVIRSR